MLCAYASHGDTRHVCLYPANPEECFYMAVQAFDLAERLQTPVLVLSDLDIGMNDWMCRDLKWDDSYRPDRGKVLGQRGDPRSWRSSTATSTRMATASPTAPCPGVHPKAAYFTRGSGHTQYGAYTEDSAEYQVVLDRLLKKWDTAKKLVPRAVIDATAGSECRHRVARQLRRRDSRGDGRAQGARASASTTCACAPSPSARTWSNSSPRTSCCSSSSRTATRSCASLLTLETAVEKAKLRSLLHYSGLPISSGFIVEGVLAELAPRRPALQHGAAPWLTPGEPT